VLVNEFEILCCVYRQGLKYSSTVTDACHEGSLLVYRLVHAPVMAFKVETSGARESWVRLPDRECCEPSVLFAKTCI
jgi:hypothetical protein